MEQSLISVVVPVYNVEKYLEEFLYSLVNQTYSNLQIILVDDGSTDSCGKICDRYASNDRRITVVHQKNAGAGAAKNTGLDLVKGEYLSIVDSDDYLELNYYERMIQVLSDSGADICQCLFDYVYQDFSVKIEFMFESDIQIRELSNKRFLREALADWKYNIFCNKLFKTSLLKDNRFPVGSKIDDEFFTYKIICSAKRIVNLSEVLYHYRQRKSSVMGDSQQLELIINKLRCFDERYNYISCRFPSLKKEYYHHITDYIDSAYNRSEAYSKEPFIQEMYAKYPKVPLSFFEKLQSKLLFLKFKGRSFTYTNQQYFD